MRIAEINERKQWRCAGCGKIDFWGDSWSWWGSLKMLDDGDFKDIIVVCSDNCKAGLG